MTGRKQFDPDEALDAATRVFWEKSYSATSISDLVFATGLSRGSLYATFGDKQELFLSCLHRYVQRVGEAARTALVSAADDARAPIMASFTAMLDRMADPNQPDGCLLAQTAAESGALQAPIRAAVQQILNEQVHQVHQVLARHAPPNREAESHALAHYVVTAAQALAVMHRAGTPVDQLRTTAAQAMRALDVLTSD